MKLRLARLGVLLIALLGLMATMVPAAQADTYKLIFFTGFADLSSGLGYPGVGKVPCETHQDPTQCVTYKYGPKNEPQVNINPGGNTAGFLFNAAVCVKASHSTPDKDPQKNGVDLCALTAAGVVTGFCGLSTGMGVAKLVNLTSDKDLVETSFKFTGVGGVLHVSGGDKETNIYAEVVAVPEPSTAPDGPSCTRKTATRFVLTGVAYYKDCNDGGTTAGVCNP